MGNKRIRRADCARSTAQRVTMAVGLALALGIVVLPWMVTRAAQTPMFSVVYTFTGGADGWQPAAPLIADRAGNLYGTTTAGGADGFGVVFKIDPQGTETVLHSFTGGTDGGAPYAPLVLDSAGNLYGTTIGGGLYDAGTVYELDPAGNETVLYSFTGGSDGLRPYAGLVRDGEGNLYGTTEEGGNFNESCPSLGCGVVFKLDPTGTETVLRAFDGTDGIGPTGSLLASAAGEGLYGTTYAGGTQRGGTVFKLDLSGNETVLYNFTGGTDGGVPDAGVARDAAGNLYGTTQQGGTTGGSCSSYGCGVVFQIDPAGSETVLDSFNWTDGGVPTGGLVMDRAGNLYGAASGGGTYGSGVIFRLSATGKKDVLYNFKGLTDGSSPGVRLLPYGGYFYSTTSHGGSHGAGVVFKLKIP
jgi:uncharacterized repeat protein (TIGR03803 family)